MNRKLSVAAFTTGALVVTWVAAGYFGSNLLALAMTAIIGGVYLVGAAELRRFHLATTSLQRAVTDTTTPPATLATWLAHLHPSLQNAVRLRIEGERVGLPGPAMTPYLVGLLVMLGMLGTFLGMVVTLNGAVLALEGGSDLQALRAALAAPVKGLGLAFGTSVAGVSASAMLGLISAILRRERIAVGQQLDSKIATVLRDFSLTHQRQETFKALQVQSQALPDVAARLQDMMAQLDRQTQTLHDSLLASQARFHQDIQGVYTDLARAVDRSLKESLTESARLAGQTIQPVVETTMAGIARETAALQNRVAEQVAQQLDGIAARFDSTATTVATTWTQALSQHQQTSEALAERLNGTLDTFATRFDARAATLIDDLTAAHATLRSDLVTQEAERQATLVQSLADLAASLQRAWQQAGEQTLAQQQQLCATLEQTAQTVTAQAQHQSSQTIAEVTRLMHTAAEAPRAAAEVIGQLRQELSNSIARDNALLDERSRIMETLGTLLDTINHASAEQRSAIDAMVAASGTMLDRANHDLARTIDAKSAQLDEVSANLASSAVDVASLGEAFSAAVGQFADANGALVANLQRMEGALDKSMARSDEQLAYYVAQARELIDLSLMSQQQIVAELRQRADAPDTSAPKAG